jgi:chromosome segregation ATPase
LAKIHGLQDTLQFMCQERDALLGVVASRSFTRADSAPSAATDATTGKDARQDELTQAMERIAALQQEAEDTRFQLDTALDRTEDLVDQVRLLRGDEARLRQERDVARALVEKLRRELATRAGCAA